MIYVEPIKPKFWLAFYTGVALVFSAACGAIWLYIFY